MEENKNRNSLTPNRLWYFRKRVKLGQKQLAFLMGHSTFTHVSDFEHGTREPELANIIKLELLLNVPIYAMYPDLTHRLRNEISERKRRSPSLQFDNLLF